MQARGWKEGKTVSQMFRMTAMSLLWKPKILVWGPRATPNQQSKWATRGPPSCPCARTSHSQNLLCSPITQVSQGCHRQLAGAPAGWHDSLQTSQADRKSVSGETVQEHFLISRYTWSPCYRTSKEFGVSLGVSSPGVEVLSLPCLQLRISTDYST